MEAQPLQASHHPCLQQFTMSSLGAATTRLNLQTKCDISFIYDVKEFIVFCDAYAMFDHLDLIQ